MAVDVVVVVVVVDGAVSLTTALMCNVVDNCWFQYCGTGATFAGEIFSLERSFAE